MRVRIERIGGWETQVTDYKIEIPEETVREALDLIEKWTKIFPNEPTWVQTELGVPSLIIRIDGVVQSSLAVYEIEERPAGIGISSLINRQFRTRLKEIEKEWPPFEVLISPRREKIGDDYLWRPVRVVSFEDLKKIKEETKALIQETKVLIRAEPFEEEFWHFASNSVSTIRTEGRKDYGEVLGLWRKVSDPNELPWEEGFVLKPLQGSKCKDIEIWPPPELKKLPGTSTKSRIERRLRENGVMYLQSFFMPMETPPEFREKYRWMIFRVFFGFQPEKKEWTALGGLWNARSSIKIHGASDAIFGPLLVP